MVVGISPVARNRLDFLGFIAKTTRSSLWRLRFTLPILYALIMLFGISAVPISIGAIESVAV